MLMLRPEALSLIDPGAEGVIPALVLGTAFLGAALACEVSLADGTRLRLQASPHAQVQAGVTVGLRVDTAHAWLMPDIPQ